MFAWCSSAMWLAWTGPQPSMASTVGSQSADSRSVLGTEFSPNRDLLKASFPSGHANR